MVVLPRSDPSIRLYLHLHGLTLLTRILLFVITVILLALQFLDKAA